MKTHECPQEFIDFAHQVADAVGAVHRRYFRGHFDTETKADGSPVTLADRASETRMRQMVQQRYPDHGIIGEEFENHQADAEYVWIIDPIDGTRLFMTGKPLFGLLLALAHEGRFILGVIDHAILHERWTGADGHGTYFNGTRVQTRPCSDLSKAVLNRPGPEQRFIARNRRIDRVAERVEWVQWGLAPYDYGLVASGYSDLLITTGPMLHDLAPIDPVIRNAGGMATDWNGRPLDIHSPDHVVVTGDPGLLDAVLAHLDG